MIPDVDISNPPDNIPDRIYKSLSMAGPANEQGMLVEYKIRIIYQPGSMIADSDESTFEVDYDLLDIYTDDNTNNDGTLSTNSVLYDWDSALPACELV